MGRATLIPGFIAVAGLAGCGGARDARPDPIGAVISSTSPSARAADWRRVATPNDRARLRNWRPTWLAALSSARAADREGAIAREPVLFAPDRAMADAIPPAGEYRCRTFKLGSRAGAAPAFAAYPYFACRVDDEGEVVSFHKRTGSQRPVGLIFRDGVARGVFLGTMVLGDERSALDYGRDATRDMAGIVERIGDRRWRMVLPEPRFESRLDVIELVPAG